MTNKLFELFGKSNMMKVLDYLLDQEIDVTVSDMCDGTGLSRKTVDKLVNKLIDEELLVLSRKVGKSITYELNMNNRIVDKLIQLNKVILEETEKDIQKL